MTHAQKVLTFVKTSVVSISTKLSIVAVLGLAALPLVPNDAASRLGAAPRVQQPAARVELVQAKPVPLVEAVPVDPAFQLVARRRVKRQPEASEETPRNSAVTPPPAPAEQQMPVDAETKTHAAPVSRTKEAQTPPPNASVKKADSKSSKKISAIAPPEPPKASPVATEPKPDAVQAEAPKPQTWSDAEMLAALRECVRLLAPIASEVEIAPAVRHAQCGTPAPVLVKRIGSGADKVEISPPAVLNCPMVVALHTWVENTLQPAAREALGKPIVRLRNASGYVCRARNGHPLGTDRLSEHALANAIDIAGFVAGDGRTVDVARFWGPTARDRREAERTAAARAKDAKKTPIEMTEEKSAPPAPLQTNKKISLIAHRSQDPPATVDRDAKSSRKTAALARSKAISDVSADPKAIPAPPTPANADISKSAEASFLRRLHKGACGVFGTVLGPEANELHRDHFHFDLASRRHSALCQ